MNIKMNPKLRFSIDRYGSALWEPKGKVFKLNWDVTGIVYFLIKARSVDDLTSKISGYSRFSEGLIAKNIIQIVNDPAVEIKNEELEDYKIMYNDYKKKNIGKPLWAHIQPFTFCNQCCVHCYCDGSPKINPGFPFLLEKWKEVVDEMVDFGIWTIYLTGGENLIEEKMIELAQYITEKGVNTAISTNAHTVPHKILERLKGLDVNSIQVSLDGASGEVHDKIRGVSGAFDRASKNIDKLAKIKKIHLNTVVNKYNYSDVENIVKFGIGKGIFSFSFFPQKHVGRSISNDLISKSEVMQLIEYCKGLEIKYSCNIETFDMTKPCGSGMEGFAINENLDVVPCIFSVHDKTKLW